MNQSSSMVEGGGWLVGWLAMQWEFTRDRWWIVGG